VREGISSELSCAVATWLDTGSRCSLPSLEPALRGDRGGGLGVCVIWLRQGNRAENFLNVNEEENSLGF